MNAYNNNKVDARLAAVVRAAIREVKSVWMVFCLSDGERRFAHMRCRTSTIQHVKCALSEPMKIVF